MNYEEIIIGIIVNAGNARSKAMEAIHHAKNGEIDKSRERLKQSSEELGKAHGVQTSLIQQEAGGQKQEVTLLMIHAQDHLMNAMTVRDLAEEFIDMHIKMEQAFHKQK
ncbi:PTS system, cellobiose-specific IIA component [Evansella caseinilytica]|uniref:PTS system, cellobiose-specific IIA component n=1 Tax=Evansella caseinilytica TaxID=1503961 RepID=A0A1H3UTK0_9BACI|nr:PTS system, cellobiose-specific IIA component [Evansella caseinilytica]